MFFNHTDPQPRRRLANTSDSKADFSKRDFLLTINHARGAACMEGNDLMTFAGRLSVVTAYLAMAFVGAIVLGMI